MGFWATQDAASKTVNMVSALFEVGIFMAAVSAPFYLPTSPSAWIGFLLSTLGGMVIYFEMSYALGVVGFWTAESWGPRFCFEVILEFCAGAFFPIDVLPAFAQKILSWLPFPYLVYYPLSIYLERTTGQEILICLMKQAMWITFLGLFVRSFWQAGLRRYAAEGG
jgi:ABC-2 type transport system permease protein